MSDSGTTSKKVTKAADIDKLLASKKEDQDAIKKRSVSSIRQTLYGDSGDMAIDGSPPDAWETPAGNNAVYQAAVQGKGLDGQPLAPPKKK